MKVSVIIPIYNSEDYLNECIQSVLNQDFSSFELLLINDGSTDSSKEICESYSAKDERVKVFNKVNGGVSSARNLGLEQAIGDWITFVDSDDYISENYFEPVRNNPKDDWVLLKIKRIYAKKIIQLTSFVKRNYSVEEFLEQFSLYFDFAGPCAKFYRNEIIKKNEIIFNIKIHFGEDALFNITYLKYVQNIKYSPNSIYYYKYVEGGLSQNKFNFISDKYLFESLKKELLSYPIKYYTKNIYFPLERMLAGLYKNQEMSTKEKEKYLKSILKKDYITVLFLYKNTRIKYLFILSKWVGNYSLLNKILIRKTNWRK